MARSTRKSIAGHAASAARKVLPKRTSSRATATDPVTAPVKKAAAKKAAVKKAAVKKAPAKNAAPAKKAAVKKAPAKNAAPAKKAAVKKAPAKNAAPAKKAAAKNAAPAKKAPAKNAAPAKKAPAKKAPAKEAPVRQAPMSSLVVREGEDAWTRAEIKEVTTELKTERDRALATLAAQESELAGLMRDSGDGAGHDQADMGAISFERDHELSVVNNERDKVAQIDRALGRIADRSYGTCESCGNPIGKMRAMAFPRATLCLSCKQREERR